MFKGSYWTWFGIPMMPLLILGCLAIGGWLTKLGYVDGDVDTIMKLLDEK